MAQLKAGKTYELTIRERTDDARAHTYSVIARLTFAVEHNHYTFIEYADDTGNITQARVYRPLDKDAYGIIHVRRVRSDAKKPRAQLGFKLA